MVHIYYVTICKTRKTGRLNRNKYKIIYIVKQLNTFKTIYYSVCNTFLLKKESVLSFRCHQFTR